jgi:uncharacterized membrane protein
MAISFESGRYGVRSRVDTAGVWLSKRQCYQGMSDGVV